MENRMKGPHGIKNRTLLWASGPTSEFLSEEIKNRRNMPLRHGNHSIIYSSQALGAARAHLEVSG